jgi:hypothetical protein
MRPVKRLTAAFTGPVKRAGLRHVTSDKARRRENTGLFPRTRPFFIE